MFLLLSELNIREHTNIGFVNYSYINEAYSTVNKKTVTYSSIICRFLIPNTDRNVYRRIMLYMHYQYIIVTNNLSGFPKQQTQLFALKAFFLLILYFFKIQTLLYLKKKRRNFVCLQCMCLPTQINRKCLHFL